MANPRTLLNALPKRTSINCADNGQFVAFLLEQVSEPGRCADRRIIDVLLYSFFQYSNMSFFPISFLILFPNGMTLPVKVRARSENM